MPRPVMRPIAAAVVLVALLAPPAVGWPRRSAGTGPAVAQQPAPTQPSPPPSTPPAQPPAQPPTQPPSQPPAQVQPQPVVAIEVRGNRRIPTDRVLAVIAATKVGEPVSEDRLRQDLRAIVDMGVFTDVTVRLEPEGDGVRVVFSVVENPVIAEVIVEGTSAIPADEVRQTLGVPTGEVLNLNRMREGAREIEKLYESKGYVLARVADLAVVPLDAAENTARLRLRVSEGRVEAVQFSGLRRTRDSTVRRLVKDTVPGKPFNVNDLNKDLQRLFDTGLFETIRAQPRPGETIDTAVIVIEVQEARTTQIGGGVGYDSVVGAVGFIEYQDRNWRGLGQTMGVRAERGLQSDTARFNYELSFTEPNLDDQRTALDLGVFSRATIDREYSTGPTPPAGTITARYEAIRSGASAALSRPLDPLTTASLRLKTELTAFTLLPLDPNLPPDPVTNPSNPPSVLSPGKVVSLTLSGVRDARDDRLLPRRGDRSALSLEFAHRLLGSDFTFSKYVVEYQRFFPIGRESALLGRLLYGGSWGNVPLQEQFVLGGPSTVRALPSGFTRNTSIVVANVEYRFPLGALIKPLGEIQAILFADAGSAPAQIGTFHSGYGIGVAVKTPVGPLRIDFAFGPQGRQTWLSVGSPF